MLPLFFHRYILHKKILIGFSYSLIPVGFRTILMLFLSFMSQKIYPGEFLRPEVVLSRSYQRNCCIWLPPISSSICLELEANLFRIFISLWYLPLVKIPKKCSRQEWHVLNNLTGNYTIKHFFPLNNRCYNYCKKNVLPIFIAEVVKKAYSFIKIMKPISPN